MEKGTAILFYVIMLPLSGLLLITWLFTYLKWKKHYALYALISLWVFFISGTSLFHFAEPLLKPMIVSQQDIYGTYVIDRDKFPGRQSDWQYENFRFKITPDDRMIFESRVYGDYWKTETVQVSYSTGYFNLDKEEYCNKKIRIHSDSTNHHIIRDNPTLYRKRFNRFYYVFNSKKFGNVFFKKGKWNMNN